VSAAGTVVRVLAPAVALTALVLVLKRRGRSLREELALRWPGLAATLPWLAAFGVLVALQAWLEPVLGIPPAEPWGARYPAAERALRVLGIVLVAPVAEELIFRGALFTQLARTRLGPLGAVVVTAVAFAALHVQYGVSEVALILVDGVFYGSARALTGSSLVSLLCHMLGNGYAAWERLAA
jgi:membrane protease YdiL (CAAX protease family)